MNSLFLSLVLACLCLSSTLALPALVVPTTTTPSKTASVTSAAFYDNNGATTQAQSHSNNNDQDVFTLDTNLAFVSRKHAAVRLTPDTWQALLSSSTSRKQLRHALASNKNNNDQSTQEQHLPYVTVQSTLVYESDSVSVEYDRDNGADEPADAWLPQEPILSYKEASHTMYGTYN